MNSFVAIDFETANSDRASACQVGVATQQDGRIAVEQFLVRPPTRVFEYTWVHGLRWADVRDAPTFAELWPTLEARIGNADFLAAHNVSFDQGVLRACCTRYGLPAPGIPFVCTVQLARSVWAIHPTKLPDVCRRLGIPLQHHSAGSDAEACARIVLAAAAVGWQPPRARRRRHSRARRNLTGRDREPGS